MMKPSFLSLFFLSITLVILGQGKALHPSFKPNRDSVQMGTASFYSDRFEGKKTSNGEVFSQKKLTCAHNSLPLGTWVKITNVNNDKFVLVRVTDRMHRKNKRLVDLSRAAAKELGYTSGGLARVKLEVLGEIKDN